ncbi:IS1096 element passenger TnpR family protein [Thiorhodovibrio frisius]|uniref:Plasmid pRiA4b ORF-3-like protein n=1 Tax=Thiorhodovibrio frisius TaxID=631362 RepID=H8Z2T2_9GAMM|nr:hypothetical protein [Thiorhodovibrio frisius]EIC21668.1 Plasmid pRiA4b ORF-3-like protein [Thiorhodovibrio frisius]WPL21637.1 Plasmid pRiA4b ORF-3-like protein [Thiorhodovibrio frisius]
MIITLKIEGAYGSFDPASKDWYRLIEIPTNSNLEVLHLCIQKAIDFDNDHMYEFFIANNTRSREKTRFDNENAGLWDVPVGQLFPLGKHKKLFYLFDYGDSWYFRISRTRRKIKAEQPGTSYPHVVEAVGKNPVQYPAYF